MNAAKPKTVGRIRVLLVDDAEGCEDALSKRPTGRNFQVPPVRRELQGSQALPANDFDVAVLDPKVEDMDRIEALKVFNKMCPVTAVVMRVGRDSEQAARDGTALGAFDRLMKPCELDMFVHVITQAYTKGGEEHDHVSCPAGRR